MFPHVQPQFFLLQFLLLRRVHSLFFFGDCFSLIPGGLCSGLQALINQTLQHRTDGPAYLSCPLQAQLSNLLLLNCQPDLCIRPCTNRSSVGQSPKPATKIKQEQIEQIKQISTALIFLYTEHPDPGTQSSSFCFRHLPCIQLKGDFCAQSADESSYLGNFAL